jgi:hypothetical protein
MPEAGRNSAGHPLHCPRRPGTETFHRHRLHGRVLQRGDPDRGPAAKALGGNDISFFAGLPIVGVLYYLFSRSLDVDLERRVAD